MSTIFIQNSNKKNLNIFSILLMLAILCNERGVLGADITPGTSVITNQCSTLGSNNPLRLLDCSIFKLSKGMCCMMTVTTSETVEVDGVQSIEESYKTACIVLQKYDAETIRKLTNQYKKVVGDVLIECNQRYLSVTYIYLLLVAVLF